MTREEKEAMKDKAIHDAMCSIENRVRHVYNQGYSDGLADGNINSGLFADKVREAYNNGLEDAWECARTLCDTDVGETQEIFGMSWWRVFDKMSATEAMQKLKEYKQALIDTGTIDEPKQTDKSCETCTFAGRPTYEFPCSACSASHTYRWEPRKGASE